jgi:hypothetical protein
VNIKPSSPIQKASQILLRGFLIFTVLFIFLSCASVPLAKDALSAPARDYPVRGNPFRGNPASFASLEDVEPEWLSFADGVGYFHGKIANPRLEFWVLQIDLRSPQTRIVVRAGASDNSSSNRSVLSTRVSSFVRDNGLAAGINAVPFNISSTKERQPIINSGLVISGGETLSPANPRYDAIVFYADGKAAVVRQSSVASAENIENAAGGFHHILVNGEPAQRTLNREGRHPRSAAGVSANGDILYLLVIDGKRAGSIGGTEKETALLLLALGSWNGINLDGGGSSAIALRTGGRVTVVNKPVHGVIPGRERAVAGCLGIDISPSTEK